MSKLFSYVVDHDDGYAPNPFGGYCSLVHCKFKGVNGKKRNIVELAEAGDWILGTGGKSKRSSGNGTIIYLMRVDFKPNFAQYLSDHRFSRRFDSEDFNFGNEFALVSNTFFYFGRSALPISNIPRAFRVVPLEKRGQGFRRDFTARFVQRFTQWFLNNFRKGMSALPCSPDFSLIDTEACKSACKTEQIAPASPKCPPKRTRCKPRCRRRVIC